MQVRAIAAALTIGVALTLMSACEDLEASIDFENQTDESVWVGYNGHAPDAFDIRDALWTQVPAGERVTILDVGGCLEDGELVIATQPEESAVIDARPFGESSPELCSGQVWEWSGIGDHD